MKITKRIAISRRDHVPYVAVSSQTDQNGDNYEINSDIDGWVDERIDSRQA
jgi:hypothetical protein